MLIKDIVNVDKRKVRIILDTQEKFLLYKGEIRKYNISVNQELDESIYIDIMTNVLKKRCRERAMFIIEKSEKTERDVRYKLAKGEFPEGIIDEAISFLKKYNYIDDEQYAKHYITAKCSTKSRRQIEYELINKGIDRNTIKDSFDACEYSFSNTISKLISSKKYDLNDENQRTKCIQYLMRKGFSYYEILDVIKEN